MELGPPIDSVREQNSSEEKKGSKKSKKKDAEKLGALVVEANPADETKKSASLWEKLTSADKFDKKEPKLEGEQSSNDTAPELNAEAPLEHLSEVERQAAATELAHSRREQLAGELAESVDDASALLQAEAASAYLAKIETSGDPDAAFAETIQEFDLNNADVEAEPVDAQIPLEGVIDTNLKTEVELPLRPEAESEESADESMRSKPGATTPPPRPPSSFGVFAGSGAGINTAPPAAASPNDAAYYERRALGRGLLVGGIVGNLIGRRRGRIKTEKRLLPVQHKLEQEVKSLQLQVAEKEVAIRQAAADKRRASLSTGSERMAFMAAEQQQAWLAEQAAGFALQAPSERIGRVVVTAESGRAQAERGTKSSVNPETLNIEKQVASMSRAELLRVSETIVVEGSTLRQVYETHLVGERGLRRLVAEHLRGGDLMRALRRELVEREIDFERDPILRDRARASLAGSGKSALNNLVKQAGAVAVLEDKPNSTKAETKAIQTEPKSSRRQSRNKQMADVALISTITILLAFIIVLLLRG